MPICPRCGTAYLDGESADCDRHKPPYPYSRRIGVVCIGLIVVMQALRLLF